MSKRLRVIALGIVAAVAAVFAIRWATLRRGADVRPVDAVPRDAFLVASINLAELRRSPVYDVVFGKESPSGQKRAEVLDARALGIAKLEEACGFEPLSRVDELAIGVPEEGDKGELGVAARVRVTSEEMSRCAASLAGKSQEAKDISGFRVVESTGEDRARLGYGHGLLVVGRGAWFDAMLAAADGKGGNVSQSNAHTALKSALTDREGWRSPTVLVTAVLPRSLRDRLKGEMSGEVGSGGQPIMAGVLGVGSVGLAVRASDQTIEATIDLVCDTADACGAVEKLVGKKRLEWSKELMLRMAGLGPLLDSIDIKRDGSRVRVSASSNASALATTLDRVLRYKARGSGGNEPPPPPARAPDEKIPAKP